MTLTRISPQALRLRNRFGSSWLLFAGTLSPFMSPQPKGFSFEPCPYLASDSSHCK
jgi:hypothetical protein